MERIGAILVRVLADVEDRIAERKSRIGAAVGVHGHGSAAGEDGGGSTHAGKVAGAGQRQVKRCGSPPDDTRPAAARACPKITPPCRYGVKLSGRVNHDASIPTMAAMTGIAMQATTAQ